jgi:hypothetical protein
MRWNLASLKFRNSRFDEAGLRGRWLVGWTEWLPTYDRLPQHHHHYSIATTPMAFEEILRTQTAKYLAFDGWMGHMISGLATPEFPLLPKASLIYCRAIVSMFSKISRTTFWNSHPDSWIWARAP